MRAMVRPLETLHETHSTAAGSAGTDTEVGAGGEFWKERYLLSERRLRELDDENRTLRNKVLDAVL